MECDGCAKPFHQACLAEWLQALPSTQQSFNRLFGECVYCSKPISIEAGAMSGDLRVVLRWCKRMYVMTGAIEQ